VTDPQPPQSVDLGLDQPNAARMYDYYLGGSHNFAQDREAAQSLVRVAPGIITAARGNRSFLHRAVCAAAAEGIDQFLDLGSGIPTVGNVHDIARGVNPEARVVYVDCDPVAVTHARVLVAGDDRVGVVHADLRDVAVVLEDPTTVGLLDFTRPVAVLMVAVLHFIAGDVTNVVARYRQILAPDSLLVLSHGTPDHPPAQRDAAAAVAEVYTRTPTPVCLRTRAEISRLFGDFELLTPGLVAVDQWRPEPGIQPDPDLCGFLAGVGIQRRASHRSRPTGGNRAPQRISPRKGGPRPTL